MEDGQAAAVAAEQAMLRCDTTLSLAVALHPAKWVWWAVENDAVLS